MFPLHIRSYYSLMQGTMSPAQICARAKSFGYSGVALTDRDNLYGLWPFLAACAREGLRPIVGSEVSEPASDRIVTCLVRSEAGYANLCNLLTRRHGDRGFLLQEMVPQFADGLFVLCRDSDLLDALQRQGVNVVADLGPRPTEKAAALRRWARHRRVRAVATHDCAVADDTEVDLYMLLRAIAENRSVSDVVARQDGDGLHGFAAPSVYRDRFAIWPEVLGESYRLAQECPYTGPRFGLVMPPWQGRGSAGETLRRWAYRGAQRRYGTDLSEAVVERLEHELDIIDRMGFSSYFLVVRNIVHRPEKDGTRRKRRICGRGSGAASLVAYCLEITNVCPIKYNLYFERFLNPGRSDPPDIDIDFAWDERDEVLQEVLSDHQGHAAMVCNHIGFKPRMAIRETAKAYGIPGFEISRITRKIPWFHRRGGDLFAQVKDLPTLRGENLGEPWPTLIRQAGRLIGIPRYLSVHPGGVVIAPGPISDYVPVEFAPKGVPIIQWEKDGAEQAGLVKIDLLGNRSLGVIRDCLATVRAGGTAFAEEGWEPEDDGPTRDQVARGGTMGCFYIESPAMRLLQQKGGSGDYEQLVIQSSIIRPAANEFVREYVRRLHGGAWQPLHPLLGDVLDETFGLMVYQEDVSRVAVQLAGFSHARADGLRKVLSKKDRELRLADYREEFFHGCRANRIDSETIAAIWAMMMSFDGYSFCKPHSASYARVSFQAAYLKTHFPAEFMAAVISNHGGYYSTFAYVSEAKRCGVAILPPDVNRSLRKWKGRNRQMRVGLETIHGLSEALIERVCRSRSELGPYRSPADFLQRTEPAEDEARQLIHAGALDSLQRKPNRTVLLWQLAAHRRRQAAGRQTSLFPVPLPEAPQLAAPGREVLLRREYQALGFLCAVHPVVLFRIRAGARVLSTQLQHHAGRRVRFLGWLLTGKLVATKAGEAMEFLTFEDEFGLVEATFFPRVYQRYATILRAGKAYVLHGLVERDFGAVTLTVETVDALEKVR